MDDLITWLRGVLDEDERAARDGSSRGEHWSYHDDGETAPPGEACQTLFIGDDGTVFLGWAEDDALRPAEGEHIARHDPASVLADVAAKRAILDLHFEATLGDTGLGAGDCETCMNEAWPCRTLQLLASAYSTRPGYRPEWAPLGDTHG